MDRLEPPYLEESDLFKANDLTRRLTRHEAELAKAEISLLSTPCNYPKYLRLDAWTLQQAICIIQGIDPDEALGVLNVYLIGRVHKGPAPDLVFRACAMFRVRVLLPVIKEMQASFFAGKLKLLSPWSGDLSFVEPREVARWAAAKGYQVQEGLDFLGEQMGPTVTGPGHDQQAVTPEDVVAQCRAEGIKDPKDIARRVDGIFTGDRRLSSRALGQLLPADPSRTSISTGGQRDRGKRLRGGKP